MNTVWLLFTILLLSLQSVGWKIFGLRYMKGTLDHYAFNSIVCLLMALLFFLLSASEFGAAATTVWTGILFGLTTPLCLICVVRALNLGPMAYTSLISSVSLIVPTAFGWLFLGEELRGLQVLAIGVLLFSFFLGLMRRGESSPGQSPNRRLWLLYALLAALLNGFLGIIQKIQAITLQGRETFPFLSIGYATAALFMLGVSLIMGKRAARPPYRELLSGRLRPLLGWGLLIALSGGGGNWFTLFLSGRMAAGILFPMATGGCLLFAALWGRFLFRERMSKRQCAGLTLGAAALLLLGTA